MCIVAGMIGEKNGMNLKHLVGPHVMFLLLLFFFLLLFSITWKCNTVSRNYLFWSFLSVLSVSNVLNCWFWCEVWRKFSELLPVWICVISFCTSRCFVPPGLSSQSHPSPLVLSVRMDTLYIPLPSPFSFPFFTPISPGSLIMLP